MNGKIYLLPSFLGDSKAHRILPQYNLEIINTIKYYIVENERTARRALIKMGIVQKIDNLTFFVLDKHNDKIDYRQFMKPLEDGENIGILSESGCPGIADPGSEIVKLAHLQNIEVVPLVGASSIFLALMASGFNGQSFKFHGYIPIKNPERAKKIKELEINALKNRETQIFIETPYRNLQLLNDLIINCSEETKLCIACDITLETEFIKTKNLKDWKIAMPKIDKRTAVFLIC